MESIEIAGIVSGVFVVFAGLLSLSMHLVNRHKKDFQDPDPVDDNDEV
jgi:hypothetical protein